MNAALTILGLTPPAMAVVRVLMHPGARAERAHRRQLAAGAACCGGQCTTADQARRAR